MCPLLGQGTFFIGNKTYPCSDELLVRDSRCFVKLSIRVIKDDKKAFLAIKESSLISGYGGSSFPEEGKIKGKVLLYLDDNTIITLIDRGKYDKVNGVYTTIYNLTESEVNRLCTTNIFAIRYSQIVNPYGEPEAISLDNADCKSQIYIPNEKPSITPRIDFPLQFRNLFKAK